MKSFIECPSCGTIIQGTHSYLVTDSNTVIHFDCVECGSGGSDDASDFKIIPALSIRQPWAWLIVSGYKNLENRNKLKNFRGPFLIHAGKRYDKDWQHKLGFHLNIFSDETSFLRGGIVGIATITDSITESDSPWFTGTNAFVIENPKPLPFIPCEGQLGFFYPKIS